MSVTEQIKTRMSGIQLQQGETFIADEAAITKAAQELDSAYSNIIIKILSILGGIISSVFFVGFLALADILESDIVLLVLGLIFVIGSLLAGRVIRNMFLDTTIISLYVLGVVMICIGIYDMTDSNNIVILAILISGILALLISERFIPKFLGCLFVFSGIYGFVHTNNYYNLIAFPVIISAIAVIVTSFSEAAFISAGKKANNLFKPLQAGSFISFLGGIIITMEMSVSSISMFDYRLMQSAIWLGIFFLVYTITRDFGDVSMKNKMIVYAITAALAIPLFFASYVSGALLMILLTWHLAYRTEFVISLGFLVYGLGRYYYDLRITLLQKSGILCLSGLLLLVLWIIIRAQNKTYEKN